MDWFYANESEQQISFDEENFQNLVAEGSIKEGTLVWNETMKDWKPCSEVRPDLFGIVPSPSTSFSSDPSQPPAVPPPMGVPSNNDGVAIASLVCGIMSFICFPINLLPAIAAVVCGHISRKKLVERTGSTEGGGMSLAGLILGYIGIVIGIGIIVIYAVIIVAAVAAEQT